MNEHIYINQFFIRNLTLKKKRKSYAEEINVSKTLIVKCWACDKPVVHPDFEYAQWVFSF